MARLGNIFGYFWYHVCAQISRKVSKIGRCNLQKTSELFGAVPSVPKERNKCAKFNEHFKIVVQFLSRVSTLTRVIKPPLATVRCDGRVHLFVCPSVCLFVCLLPNCKKRRFSQKPSNLKQWCLLTTYRKLCNWAFQRTHYWIPKIQAEIRYLENRYNGHMTVNCRMCMDQSLTGFYRVSQKVRDVIPVLRINIRL